MIRSLQIIFLVLSLFILLYCCHSRSPDKELRKKLEASYAQYVESLQTEDEEKIRRTMSSYGYAVSKNYYADLNKHNANGSLREFDESSLPPEDAIDGEIRPAPPLLPEVEVVGSLNVICRGFKVEVTINTKPQAVVENTTLFTPIKGGLKFGENSIKIKSEKSVPKGRNVKLESKMKDQEMFKELFEKVDVSIKAKRGGKYIQVFEFRPGIKIEGTHIYTFMVH